METKEGEETNSCDSGSTSRSAPDDNGGFRCGYHYGYLEDDAWQQEAEGETQYLRNQNIVEDDLTIEIKGALGIPDGTHMAIRYLQRSDYVNSDPNTEDLNTCFYDSYGLNWRYDFTNIDHTLGVLVRCDGLGRAATMCAMDEGPFGYSCIGPSLCHTRDRFHSTMKAESERTCTLANKRVALAVIDKFGALGRTMQDLLQSKDPSTDTPRYAKGLLVADKRRTMYLSLYLLDHGKKMELWHEFVRNREGVCKLYRQHGIEPEHMPEVEELLDNGMTAADWLVKLLFPGAVAVVSRNNFTFQKVCLFYLPKGLVGNAFQGLKTSVEEEEAQMASLQQMAEAGVAHFKTIESKQHAS